MANEIRKYSNLKSGTITNNPLAVSDVTLSSAGLAGLEVVGATEHRVITIDPLGAGAGPEIVYVVSHTVASTDATVIRGREGTTAVQHPTGTAWVSAEVASDDVTVGITAERPTGGSYKGRQFYDVENGEWCIDPSGGALWVPMGLSGAFRDYPPGWTASQSPPSIANGTISAVYHRSGRRVYIRIAVFFGSSTNGGLGAYNFALPFPARNIEQQLSAKLFASNGSNYVGLAYVVAGATVITPFFPVSPDVSNLGPFNQQFTAGTPNIAALPMTSGSNMLIFGDYETAA